MTLTIGKKKDSVFQGSSGLKLLLSILWCWNLLAMSCAKSLQSCLTLCNPVDCQDSLSMGFSRKNTAITTKKEWNKKKKNWKNLKKLLYSFRYFFLKCKHVYFILTYCNPRWHLVVRNLPANAGDRFSSWVGKMPWSRK